MREGVRVVCSPENPLPGGVLTFRVELEGSLADLLEEEEYRWRKVPDIPSWGYNVDVWWIPYGNTRTKSWSSSAGLNHSHTWTIPMTPGVVVYSARVDAEKTQRDGPTEQIMAISDTHILPVPSNTPFVASSPLIRLVAERKGDFMLAPYARIVAQVAKKESGPVITELSCSSESRVMGSYNEPGFGSGWDSQCSSGCGEKFVVNGSENDDWVTYISEPPTDRDWQTSLGRGNGSGIVICWVAGWDTNGTIHVAEPLVFSPLFEIEEEPPVGPDPGPCTGEGPTVRIMRVGYQPRDPVIGQEIRFQAESVPSARLHVNWEWFNPGGEQEGGMGAGIDKPFRSPDVDSVGVYQVHVHSNATWTVTDFHPITVPARQTVSYSDLISLEATETGRGSTPYAKLVARADNSITCVHVVFAGFRKCDSAGPLGGMRMEKKGGKWILPYHDLDEEDKYMPKNAIIFAQAIGVDKDGVAHYSSTINYTIGDSGPVILET